jgi:hypothetical protein
MKRGKVPANIMKTYRSLNAIYGTCKKKYGFEKRAKEYVLTNETPL